MARVTSPFDFVSLGFSAYRLWSEASMVIAMRMLGMAGLWSVRPSENGRMVAEKMPAFAAAAAAGTRAAMAGRRPDQVAHATMAPLARRARANRRRLSKAGPKSPF